MPRTNKKSTANLQKNLGGQTVFSVEQERGLMQYILTASKLNFGISVNELRTMAFEFGKKEGINKDILKKWDGMASLDWYEGFMERHPRILLRTPEQMSLQRVKGFNKESVDGFYKQLGDLYEKFHFQRRTIWNMDETFFPTVPAHVQKLLAEMGLKRVGQMSPAERETNVSCALTVNAAGQCIPPFFIFPKANYQTKFMMLAEGDEGYANKKGCMQTAEFYKFLEHFQKRSHASKEFPNLLLLNNHTTHLSIKSIDFANEHGIIMLTFPPNCTNKLQPMDNGIFAKVKARYVQKHSVWMKSHGGKKFDLEHVAPKVEQSFDEIAPADIKTAFEETGIIPLNPHTFTDSDYYAAKTIAEAEAKALMSEEGAEPGLDRCLLVLDENIPEQKKRKAEEAAKKPAKKGRKNTTST